MNEDLLSCKREAVAMANSDQPPLEKNGRKKGYIKIMREIWDAKGYGELGYTNQNLRDQAARIEEKSLDGNSQSTSRRDERMDSNSECQAIATAICIKKIVKLEIIRMFLFLFLKWNIR